MRIAIIHDDEKFSGQLQKLLETQSHVVEKSKVSDRLSGLIARVDLLVIASGSAAPATQAIQSIRSQAGGRELPILCVNPTGRSAEGVALLDAGADDFINRPFNGHIFLARIRTLLRRRIWGGALPEETGPAALENGTIALQLVSRRAAVAGKTMELTRLEFDLLAFFLRAPDRAFSRQEILEAVWNYPHDVETRTLDKHVETLRRKLGPAGARIATVHGMGYRLVSEPARR